MQDGHHLAAGGICLHHDAHKVALIADDGIAHGHTVHGAAVQRKAAKLIQWVAADHKAGNITGLAVGILNAGQRLVGFVLSLDAVVVHHLLAQFGVLGFQLFVLGHHIIDAGVFFPHRTDAAAQGRSHLLKRRKHHAQQLLRGGSQPAIGAGIGHNSHQKHRHRHQYLKFPCVKKILQGGVLLFGLLP